jgi:hypothetical protein
MDKTELKLRLTRGMRDLQNFLRTNEGKNSLMVFEAKYGGSVIVPNNPYETYKRIGEKEVLEYLLQLKDGENV